MIADAFRWTRDANGEWLCIRTKSAQSFLQTVKPDKQYVVEIKQYHPKRTLNANNFYWSVLTEFAKALSVSINYAHNMMLRRYGQLERIDDQIVYLVLPDTEEAEKKADEAETYHIKPTSEVKQGRDGKMYRTYILLRGSKTFNSSEFSRLVDGLISECKDIGLDVISERERSLLEYG